VLGWGRWVRLWAEVGVDVHVGWNERGRKGIPVGQGLTPGLEGLAAFVDEQPPEVREAFQLCLAVALEEKGKAKLVNTAQVDGRTYYSYETVAGDVFSVVRLEIGAGAEREVREWLVRLMQVHVGGYAAPYGPAQGGPCPLDPQWG